MNKRLSIVTINFNQIDALKLTLNSIRNAACNKNLFQLIVIDGRSTDGSTELLRDYADVISIGISEPDKGIFDAMNKGLNYATGDYVIFMNSGDTFCSDILNINFI